MIKYAYNQLGQRILDDRSMPNGNQVARFTYNQRLELVKSVRDRGCGPDEVHTYAYDLNHNWTKKDGVSYTNNLADQLLGVTGGGSLSYNDSGQATDVQGWDVTYNCAEQITGIQAPGKNIAYRYDGAGQRVEKTVNGVTQKFLWNGGDIAKEYKSDGSVRADYFLGAGREGIKTNGQWHWYLSDIQGSTLMLTNSAGNSAATYDYSDYGETRQTSGSTGLYNPFLYTGQEYDFETSLYHLRARHYSPANGRFFSRDPIGYAGGSNMYAYCFNDPIGLSDPTGLSAVVGAVDLVKNDEERLYVPLARLAIYPFANVVYSLSLDVEIKLKLRNGNVKVLFNKTFQGHPYIESRYSDLPALVDVSKWLPRIPFKDLCGGIALTLDLDGSYRNQYGIPALVGRSSIVKTLE